MRVVFPSFYVSMLDRNNLDDIAETSTATQSGLSHCMVTVVSLGEASEVRS